MSGSRCFNDYQLFKLVMHGYLREYHTGHDFILITGQASRGADDMIIRYCEEFDLSWKGYPANWELGKSAGYRRNVQMCEACTHVIAFWDLVSRGTKHMIDIAKKAGKPLFVALVQRDEDVARKWGPDDEY